MPFFEAKVIVQVVVLVEADNEDEALARAFDEADPLRAEYKEAQSTKQLNTPEEIDRARRHCDQVLS